MVSASCSLLHVPYDVGLEDDLPAEVRPWLAFAEQKLAEIVTLTRAVNEGEDAVAAALAANRAAVAVRGGIAAAPQPGGAAAAGGAAGGRRSPRAPLCRARGSGSGSG